jgi:predicted RNA-binding Zn ribbon-like protein
VSVEAAATRAPLLGEPLPVELMNTVWADRDGVHDALSSPGEAAAWLGAVADRLLSEPPSAGTELRDWLKQPQVATQVADQLRLLRDALRLLAADATADPRTTSASSVADRDKALTVLNRACALAPAWSELTWPADGTPRRITRSDRAPAESAISGIAEQGVALFGDPTRARLRACLAPGCVLYFVKDHPRKEWCTAGCGNRARVARHYQRHRGTDKRGANDRDSR